MDSRAGTGAGGDAPGRQARAYQVGQAAVVGLFDVVGG